jgi:hypothetical protein
MQPLVLRIGFGIWVPGIFVAIPSAIYPQPRRVFSWLADWSIAGWIPGDGRLWYGVLQLPELMLRRRH